MFTTFKGLFSAQPDEITESQEEEITELGELLSEESEEESYDSPEKSRKGLSWFLSTGDESDDTTESTENEDSVAEGYLLESGDPAIISDVVGIDPYQVPVGELPDTCRDLYRYLGVEEPLRSLFSAGAHFAALSTLFEAPPAGTPLKHLFPEIVLEQRFVIDYERLVERLGNISCACREHAVEVSDDFEIARGLLSSLLREFEQKYKNLLNVSNSVVQFKRALGNFSARTEAMEFIRAVQTTRSHSPVRASEMCQPDQESTDPLNQEQRILQDDIQRIIEYIAMLCFENEKFQELISKHQITASQHESEMNNLIAVNESQISLICQLKSQLETCKSRIQELEQLPPPAPKIVHIERPVPSVLPVVVQDTPQGPDFESLFKQEQDKNIQLSATLSSLENKLKSCEKQLNEELEGIISSSGELVSQQTGITQILNLDSLRKTVAEQRRTISGLGKQFSDSQRDLESSLNKIKQMEQTQSLLTIRTNLAHQALAKLKSEIKIVV